MNDRTASPTSPLTATAIVAVIAGTVVVLHALGRGALAAPPVTAPAELGAWADQRDAMSIALALLRLMLLGLAYHLLATSSVAIIGRILRRPGLVTWADAWTLPLFRSTVGRVVGLGLSASTILAGPIQSAAASSRPATPEIVVQRIALDPISGDRPSEGAVLRRLPAAPAPQTTAAVPAAPPASTVQVVAPGDHLWSISETALTARLGRPPTDAELTPYWATVVRANPQLADPDLIYPGETVNVPPPP